MNLSMRYLILFAKDSESSLRFYRDQEQNHSQTFEIGFVVEDVVSVIEKLRAHGVAIVREPVEKPWGQTVAYIADPDGHFIEICTPIG